MGATACRLIEIVFEAAPQSFIQSHVLWVRSIAGDEPLQGLQLTSIAFSVISIGLGLRSVLRAFGRFETHDRHQEQDSGTELKEEVLDSAYFVVDAVLRLATLVTAIGYMGPLGLASWAGSWLLMIFLYLVLFAEYKVATCCICGITCGLPAVWSWLVPLNRLSAGVNNGVWTCGPRVALTSGLARAIEMLILALLPAAMAAGGPAACRRQSALGWPLAPRAAAPLEAGHKVVQL